MEDKNLLAEITADVVSSYVSKNKVAIGELPDLIVSIHDIFSRLTHVGDEIGQVADDLVPAVPLGESITENYLICLEDGLKFKSLKRHLRSHHQMSAEQYREKWELPADYPMVAPSYSKKRSKLARENGLGKSAQE